MLTAEDQEMIEQIISIKCPEMTSVLDLDTEGMDVLTTRFPRQTFDLIICTGKAFTDLTSDEDLRSALRTFVAHAHLDTVLIVKRPEAFHQAQLETRARSYRFIFCTCFGSRQQLQVFGFDSQMVDAIDEDGF